MGIFESIFRRPRKVLDSGVGRYFQVLNGYAPVFTSYNGGLYEMELTRAAIHAIASACSKLKPEVSGSARRNLEKTLQFRPNPFMDTTKFLYRLATILLVSNNAFIVPVEDEYGALAGYFPLIPQNAEVVEYESRPYMRYTFSNGKRAAIEFEKVGILTRHQLYDDFFGESNDALKPTMQLIHSNNQGIVTGIKNSAAIRFLAKVNNMIAPEDIDAERERFTRENLSAKNQSGIIIYDQKFEDMKPIDSKPFTVNAPQMQQIAQNVYNYFGVSEAILQNKYDENQWNAFYEGAVEPFAMQLSLVMTNMTFTPREIACGNAIYMTSNRLQYAGNMTKLQVSTQLFDRGLITMNQVMDIWNMKHVADGDKRYIRKEYAEVSRLGEEGDEDAGSGDAGIPHDDDADGGGAGKPQT